MSSEVEVFDSNGKPNNLFAGQLFLKFGPTSEYKFPADQITTFQTAFAKINADGQFKKVNYALIVLLMLPQDAQSKIIKFTEVIKNETDPESAEFKSALTDLESVDKLIPDSVSDEFSKYNKNLQNPSPELLSMISKKLNIEESKLKSIMGIKPEISTVESVSNLQTSTLLNPTASSINKNIKGGDFGLTIVVISGIIILAIVASCVSSDEESYCNRFKSGISTGISKIKAIGAGISDCLNSKEEIYKLGGKKSRRRKHKSKRRPRKSKKRR